MCFGFGVMSKLSGWSLRFSHALNPLDPKT